MRSTLLTPCSASRKVCGSVSAKGRVPRNASATSRKGIDSISSPSRFIVVPSSPLKPSQILMRKLHGYGAFTDRRSDTFHGAVANIAGHEDTGDAGLEQERFPR